MAFMLRSNTKSQEKADKNVFIIDKAAVSAARPTRNPRDFTSVPGLPKLHGLNGTSDDEHDFVGSFPACEDGSAPTPRRASIRAAGAPRGYVT